MKCGEFRPVAGFEASILFVETSRLANRNRHAGSERRGVQGLRKREGMWSSRSNWTSSNEAAMPNQPGTDAGS
jgi:hypothetical protein